jgi:glutathione S-transferase
VTDFNLFVSPGTCARVPTVALEEIGVPFTTTLLRFAEKQQKTAEFLAINPKGKVPTLVVDGQPLTENVAILSWLNRQFPDAALFPKATNDYEASKQIADLAYFSATVHPLVTRIAMPMKFMADAKESFNIVRPQGITDMNDVMTLINERLEEGPWWYGEQWSIVDAYLFWAWWRITGVGYPQDAFPNIKRHAEEIIKRPSVARAMQREAENVEILKSEGNYTAPR